MINSQSIIVLYYYVGIQPSQLGSKQQEMPSKRWTKQFNTLMIVEPEIARKYVTTLVIFYSSTRYVSSSVVFPPVPWEIVLCPIIIRIRGYGCGTYSTYYLNIIYRRRWQGVKHGSSSLKKHANVKLLTRKWNKQKSYIKLEFV